MDDSIRPKTAEEIEAERIAADLAYERAKNNGTLQHQHDNRALADQIDRQGNCTTTGLWA